VVVADNEVTTSKILDANVTAGKLAATLDLSGKTVTLPDDSVTDAKLSLAANAGEVKKALNADNSPPIFACRAWASFQGRSTNGTCTVDGSGNVASISRTGAGQYTLTFTTAMPDANYAVIGSGHWDATIASAQNTITVVYPVLSTGFSFTISDASGNSYQDPSNSSLAIFR
jgi:hypothetical protein